MEQCTELTHSDLPRIPPSLPSALDRLLPCEPVGDVRGMYPHKMAGSWVPPLSSIRHHLMHDKLRQASREQEICE
ncbi:hypothetical protein BaRGS_00013780 [Batillaria attramentaria]|uniref:Uncharacterized protein n=1 Tax=Batillaria attramentaria TaxID=370345 RepID=A0ABD0L6M7_9CAEN